MDGGEGSISMHYPCMNPSYCILIMPDLFFATYDELVLLTKACMENAWFLKLYCSKHTD